MLEICGAAALGLVILSDFENASTIGPDTGRAILNDFFKEEACFVPTAVATL